MFLLFRVFSGSMLVFGVVAILRVWCVYEKSAFYLLYCWDTCQNIMEYRWYYIILYLGVNFCLVSSHIKNHVSHKTGESLWWRWNPNGSKQLPRHQAVAVLCQQLTQCVAWIWIWGKLGEGRLEMVACKMLGIAIPGGWNCWGAEFGFIPKQKVWKIMLALLGPCMAGSNRNGIHICWKLQDFWFSLGELESFDSVYLTKEKFLIRQKVESRSSLKSSSWRRLG